jgi:hypothetical protein
VIRTFVALFREWCRGDAMSSDWLRAQKQQAINKSAEVEGVSWKWPVQKEG